MFTVPIDGLFLAARYLIYGLILLMPVTLLAGSWLWQRLTRNETNVSSIRLTIRLLVAVVLLAMALHLMALTGHIQLTCDRQPSLTCQRERTLLYGLLKQENTLDAWQPFKQDKTFKAAEDASPYQLMITVSGRTYLLHPAHQFSRLAQISEGKHRLLTIDEAIADMQTFQRGDARQQRFYRDRVGFAGYLMTALQVVAIMPILLGLWVFSEVHFGHQQSQRR